MHVRQTCALAWTMGKRCEERKAWSCFSRGLEDLRNCLRNPCQSDTVRHTQSHSRWRCGFLGHSSRYNRRSSGRGGGRIRDKQVKTASFPELNSLLPTPTINTQHMYTHALRCATSVKQKKEKKTGLHRSRARNLMWN